MRTIDVHLDSGEVVHYTPEDLISYEKNKFLGWTCAAGVDSLFIDWDGNVYPASCQRNENGKPIGNIATSIQLPKYWFTCNKNYCHCQPEIALEKKAPAYMRRNSAATLTSAMGGSELLKHINPVGISARRPRAIYENGRKHVSWGLGRRCNYSCVYCDDDAHSKTEPLLKFEDCKRAIEQFHTSFSDGGQILYSIFGGEPTLAPWYLEFASLIHSQGHVLSTITNGSRPAQYLRELLKFSYLSISVHLAFINHEAFVKKAAEILKGGTPYPMKGVDFKIMTPAGRVSEAVELGRRLRAICTDDVLQTCFAVPLRQKNTNLPMVYTAEETAEIVAFNEDVRTEPAPPELWPVPAESANLSVAPFRQPWWRRSLTLQF